jgi:hypothetical protein
MSDIHRQLLHVTEHEIPRLANTYRNTDNIDLRLKFLLNEISEEEFQVTLQRREKKREKDVAVREIYEMLGAAGKDLMWAYVDQERNMVDTLEELRALARYANVHLNKIAVQYKMKVSTLRVPMTYDTVAEIRPWEQRV